MFQAGHHLYRGLHRRLTGRSVQIGNFSVVPAHFLSTLAVGSELWNHYSAAVFRSIRRCAARGIGTIAYGSLRSRRVYITGTLAIIITELLTMATSFAFLVLSSRRNLDFVPVRDCALFVLGPTTVFEQPACGLPV